MKYKVWYDEENGVLRADVLDTFDAETATAFFKEVNGKYTEEQQNYFMAYMSEEAQRLVDKETRRAARDGAALLKWDKLAILGAKPGLRMVTKIVMTAVGKAKDTKFFDDEEKALAWLKTEKEKAKSK
jgi:hypothetical protein